MTIEQLQRGCQIQSCLDDWQRVLESFKGIIVQVNYKQFYGSSVEDEMIKGILTETEKVEIERMKSDISNIYRDALTRTVNNLNNEFEKL